MEGLADRHQGVREGCSGGGADLRTVLPPGAIYALPQSTYICRVQSCVWRLPKYCPPTSLSTQRVCPPPALKAGGILGYTLAGGCGVNILEDARHWIGLLQYMYNLSTRFTHGPNIYMKTPNPK
jgi:hypothetical protein